MNNRYFDQQIIARWRELQIPGDPPPFVQRAFDRESVRNLRTYLATEFDPHSSDCGVRFEEECDCSARFIGMEP